MNKPTEYIDEIAQHKDINPISIEMPINTPGIDYVIRPSIAGGIEFKFDPMTGVLFNR